MSVFLSKIEYNQKLKYICCLRYNRLDTFMYQKICNLFKIK